MDLLLQQHEIRYPEFLNSDWDSSAPYSDALHIKASARNLERTKRPLNAFMLFAKLQREHLTTNITCNHSEISRSLGKLWRSLTPEQKLPFSKGSKLLVDFHRREYPHYKYQPRKKGQDAAVAGKKKGAAATGATPARRDRKPAAKRSVAAAKTLCPVDSQQLLTSSDNQLQLLVTSEPALSSPERSRHLSSPFSPLSRASSSGYESDSLPDLTISPMMSLSELQHHHQLQQHQLELDMEDEISYSPQSPLFQRLMPYAASSASTPAASPPTSCLQMSPSPLLLPGACEEEELLMIKVEPCSEPVMTADLTEIDLSPFDDGVLGYAPLIFPSLDISTDFDDLGL